MEEVFELQFWVNFLIPVLILMLPIHLIGRATPVRSFASALVIYVGIIIVAACNVSGPF